MCIPKPLRICTYTQPPLILLFLTLYIVTCINVCRFEKLSDNVNNQNFHRSLVYICFCFFIEVCAYMCMCTDWYMYFWQYPPPPPHLSQRIEVGRGWVPFPPPPPNIEKFPTPMMCYQKNKFRPKHRHLGLALISTTGQLPMYIYA